MATFCAVLVLEDKFSRSYLLRCFGDGLAVGEGLRTNAYERSDNGDIERLCHHAGSNLQGGLVIEAWFEDAQARLCVDAGLPANKFGRR